MISTKLDSEFCLKLMRTESESELVRFLKTHGLWSDRSVWRPYGDVTNNRGIVGNQQSSPVAALVEKLVNSIDAILVAESFRNGLNPTDSSVPQSMHSAVKEFLNVPDGRILNLDAQSRTMLAERIHLVVTGTKEEPCYIIVDSGEGQEPDQFPNTFLSLLKDNKTGIPFVQGKFNMGGTGVLQFAGDSSFQLIVSRRQPDIPRTASHRSDEWGFTLIRRLDPGPGQPQTMYVYLAPGGSVPSFKADFLPLLPGAYPHAYEGGMSAGTFIKVWNYKFPRKLKTLATLDLRYALERFLQDPALPIRIHERRTGYRALL